MTVTIGTNGNDTLTTSAAGDVLIGLDGTDVLSSTHLDTAIFGDGGADDIDSTGIFVVGGVAGDTETNTITQSGGDGNDNLFANVKVDTTGGLDNVLNGVFTGGGGDDTIDATMSGTASGGATGNVDISAIASGGNGADNVRAVAGTGGITSGNATAVADGGIGADTVRAEAQDSNFSEAGFSHVIADGGSSNDNVSGSLGLLGGASGGTSTGLMDMSGGFGLDTLDGFTFANSTFGANSNVSSTHNLDGGGANDQIKSNMISNGSAATISYTANILGGLGNDTIDNDMGANAIGDSIIDANIDGGGGKDVIDSLVAGLAGLSNTATITVNIDGGLDTDNIYSGVQITQGDAASTALNFIDGGNGNDTIVAEIFAASPAAEARGKNEVLGGAGADIITVIGGGDTNANRNFVDGGGGADIITGADGAADILLGGSGNDTLYASTNTNKAGTVLQDALDGGTGVDTFVFDYTADQDIQTINNYDSVNTDLVMLGLVDANANGSLVDEFDAASTIIDNGAGNNVDVALASGTLIVFAGQGTGSVSSIADLLTFDPDIQLLNMV